MKQSIQPIICTPKITSSQPLYRNVFIYLRSAPSISSQPAFDCTEKYCSQLGLPQHEDNVYVAMP